MINTLLNFSNEIMDNPIFMKVIVKLEKFFLEIKITYFLEIAIGTIKIAIGTINSTHFMKYL